MHIICFCLCILIKETKLKWVGYLVVQFSLALRTSAVRFSIQAPKKAKRRGGGGDGGSSNVFSMFEQSQIQEYKEVRLEPSKNVTES